MSEYQRCFYDDKYLWRKLTRFYIIHSVINNCT